MPFLFQSPLRTLFCVIIYGFIEKQGRERQKAWDKALSHGRAGVAEVDVRGWNQRQFLGPSAQPTLAGCAPAAGQVSAYLGRAKPGGRAGLGALAVLSALVAMGKFGENGPSCPNVP